MKRVTEFADKYGMLPSGGAVICAISGGADSVCLLHILKEIAPTRGFDLYAVHFNHCLRGAESDRDELFVRELCRELNVELFCGSGDVKGYSWENGVGIEEAARILRYRFFEETAGNIPESRVATAHNADDNAETVLMNLTRGAGLKGLCGIPPVRDIYIRPLLCMSREEINAYLETHGLEHVEDSSNAENIYTRNRLRHDVIPVLKGINPAFAGSVMETSDLIREDEKLLDTLSQQAVPFEADEAGRTVLDINKLKNSQYPLAARAVRRAAASLDCYPAAVHVRAVLELADADTPSARTSLPGGVLVSREYDRLIFIREDENESLQETTVSWGKWTDVPGAGIEIYFGSKEDEIGSCDEVFLLSSKDICGQVTVRARRTGDRICLDRRQGGKTLKKLFIEKKIPVSRREHIPIITDNEKILAISGLGRSAELSPEKDADCIAAIKKK